VTVEKFEVASDDLVKKIKEILHEANVTKIIVENEQGKTLLEIPVTVGVVGALFAPWLAALGAIGAIATKCTVKVERRE
jgi:repressor of nif and glnA expression